MDMYLDNKEGHTVVSETQEAERHSSWPARVSPLSIHIQGVDMTPARDKGVQATSKLPGKEVAACATSTNTAFRFLTKSLWLAPPRLGRSSLRFFYMKGKR